MTQVTAWTGCRAAQGVKAGGFGSMFEIGMWSIVQWLGPPVVPFCQPFWGEGSNKNDKTEKKLVPTYSNLSTGGTRWR